MQKDNRIEFLQENLAAGRNWVAYPEDRISLNPYDLECFNSSHQAEEFCKPQYSYAGSEEIYYECRYSFTAIGPLIDRLQNNAAGHIRPDQQDKVRNELSLHPVTPESWVTTEELAVSLARGEVNVVCHKRKIIPRDEISQYHLFLHELPQGKVFKSPHYRKALGTFPDYESARTACNNFERSTPPIDRITELVLIGEFKDTPLQVGYDCGPKSGTGMVIYAETLPSQQVKREEPPFFIDPSAPRTLESKLFARMDPATNTLSFYDDKLHQVDVARDYLSTNTMFFHNRHYAENQQLNQKKTTHIDRAAIYKQFSKPGSDPDSDQQHHNNQLRSG